MSKNRKFHIERLPVRELYSSRSSEENEVILNRICSYLLKLAHRRRSEDILEQFIRKPEDLEKYLGLDEEG